MRASRHCGRVLSVGARRNRRARGRSALRNARRTQVHRLDDGGSCEDAIHAVRLSAPRRAASGEDRLLYRQGAHARGNREAHRRAPRRTGEARSVVGRARRFVPGHADDPRVEHNLRRAQRKGDRSGEPELELQLGGMGPFRLGHLLRGMDVLVVQPRPRLRKRRRDHEERDGRGIRPQLQVRVWHIRRPLAASRRQPHDS